MAKTLLARMENPFDGIRGFHRATGHRPQHGVEHLSRRLRSFGRGKPMRVRSRWYPLRCVPAVCGCSGRTRVCPHPTTRQGCWSLRGSLNSPEDPWGKLRGFCGQLMPIKNMQAIKTKYLPATNYRGSRVKATCEKGTLTLPYRYDCDQFECHRETARQLFEKLFSKDFSTPMVFATGCLPDGTYAHVLI